MEGREKDDMVQQKPEWLDALLQIAPSANSPDVLKVILSDAAANSRKASFVARVTFAQRMWARFTSAMALCLLLSTFPVSLAAVVFLTVLHWVRVKLGLSLGPGETVKPSSTQKTVVISGGKMTKTLHLARHFKRAGWRVVLLEQHKYWMVGPQWSKAVDRFCTVPPPDNNPVLYLKAISKILAQEGAAIYMPTSTPSLEVYEALVKDVLPPKCVPWTFDAPTTARLNNKVQFSKTCAELGLTVPMHFHITSKEQLLELNSKPENFKGHKFLLKSLAYDSIARADFCLLPCDPAYLARYADSIDIQPTRPWMLQQFLEGVEYSSYSIAHEGRIVAHGDTVACLSNLRFKQVGNAEIWDWVNAFATRSKLSGHLCFDFIKNKSDGVMYPIECNPRVSTVICQFHDHPTLALAFISPEEVGKVLSPMPGSPHLYWWWWEVWTSLQTRDFGHWWDLVRTGKEAVFDFEDPLPFLTYNYVQLPLLLLRNVRVGNQWKKVDFCIGKLVEQYGD